MLSLRRGRRGGAGRLEGRRRPRRLRLRRRPGDLLPARRAVGARRRRGGWPPRRCGRCRPCTTELSEETRVRQRYADLTVREEARDMVRTRAAITRSIRETLHRRRLRRDRDAGAAARPRRRHGPPVPHPPERVRHRHDAADRPRAVPQAGRRRRRRPGLRDGPDLPQRGHRLHPQRRVHDAGGLPGLGRPDHDRRPDPRDHPRRRRRCSARAGSRRPPGVDRPRTASGAGCRSTRRCQRARSARRSRLETPSTRCARSPTTHGVDGRARLGRRRRWSLELFGELVEPTLLQPTFVCDYPPSAQPLARPHRSDPGPDRGLGPDHRRGRARHRVLRAGRPGGPA